jgi:hypothetical protein
MQLNQYENLMRIQMHCRYLKFIDAILVFLEIGSSFGIGGYTIKIYSLCEHLTSEPVTITRILSKRNSD